MQPLCNIHTAQTNKFSGPTAAWRVCKTYNVWIATLLDINLALFKCKTRVYCTNADFCTFNKDLNYVIRKTKTKEVYQDTFRQSTLTDTESFFAARQTIPKTHCRCILKIT